MDTVGLLHLRARLTAWETAVFGDPLIAHHQGLLGRYLAQLDGLTSTECRTPSDAATMVALALGPRDALPGAGDLELLVRAAAGSAVGMVDLGVAWGCGWGRTVTPGHGWHGRWVAAVLSLSSLVAGSLNQTVRRLAAGVPDFGEALRALGGTELGERWRSIGDEIAMELALGACRCGHGSRVRPASEGDVAGRSIG